MRTSRLSWTPGRPEVDRWPEGRIVVERAFRPDDTPRRIDIYRGSEHVLAEVRLQFANEADPDEPCTRATSLTSHVFDRSLTARSSPII
jgi:hypothetical protein